MATSSDPRPKSHPLSGWALPAIWLTAMVGMLVFVPGTLDGVRATWEAITAMTGSLLP